MRYLSPPEIVALTGQRRPVARPAAGWRWFVAVRQVRPGLRIRMPFQSPEGAEVDLPENMAACLFAAAEDANRTGLGYGVTLAEAGR